MPAVIGDAFLKFSATGLVRGIAEGEILISKEPIAFNLGIDDETGVVVDKGHQLEGKCVAGKILYFPTAKGSGGGSFSLLQQCRSKVGPVGIINAQAEAVVLSGAVLARLPVVHRVDPEFLDAVSDGDWVRIDGDRGTVEVKKTEGLA